MNALATVYGVLAPRFPVFHALSEKTAMRMRNSPLPDPATSDGTEPGKQQSAIQAAVGGTEESHIRKWASLEEEDTATCLSQGSR
jgi:hypothetical protein